MHVKECQQESNTCSMDIQVIFYLLYQTKKKKNKSKKAKTVAFFVYSSASKFRT